MCEYMYVILQSCNSPLPLQPNKVYQSLNISSSPDCKLKMKTSVLVLVIYAKKCKRVKRAREANERFIKKRRVKANKAEERSNPNLLLHFKPTHKI